MTLVSNDNPEELLTLDELCKMLKLTKATVYQYRCAGTGPTGYRIGKHLRFKRSDVISWLESKRESA